jgi:rhodanese-related sulfurtransferase
MDTNRLFEFLTNHWILSILLIAVLLALAIDPLLRRLRGIRKVSAVEATRLINRENALVIDIREENEFNKEHILDSINVPLSKLSKRLESLDNFKDRPLVVIWGTGQGVLHATGQLSRGGHKLIYMLQGGIESWRQANMPLFSGKAKTKASIKLNKAEAEIPTLTETPTPKVNANHQAKTSKKAQHGKKTRGSKKTRRG